MNARRRLYRPEGEKQEADYQYVDNKESHGGDEACKTCNACFFAHFYADHFARCLLVACAVVRLWLEYAPKDVANYSGCNEANEKNDERYEGSDFHVLPVSYLFLDFQ